eukprot:TRINITY_DN2843_c0_g1_i1.p1 TRINITY_DN2843_c0_g1~~TRINITY_DN2843_c0_g1_i1.p1  ORF type:complete len:327 (-),score=94.61 TRINITY_DN2843_c0_g1_i1:1109-1981(-)
MEGGDKIPLTDLAKYFDSLHGNAAPAPPPPPPPPPPSPPASSSSTPPIPTKPAPTVLKKEVIFAAPVLHEPSSVPSSLARVTIPYLEKDVLIHMEKKRQREERARAAADVGTESRAETRGGGGVYGAWDAHDSRGEDEPSYGKEKTGKRRKEMEKEKIDPEALKELKRQRKITSRNVAGKSWSDEKLLDFPENDFRIFAGNLGKDCTDSLLEASFSRFKGFHMARIVSDPKTRRNKGYGFISFLDPQGYLDAMREMQGKFVGSHPLILRKSKWRERSSTSTKSAKKQHLW